MSYLEQTGRKNPASVAAVVGVHLAVGYALLTGLGYVVVHPHPSPAPINWVPTDPPPPPPHSEPTKKQQGPVTNRIPTPDDSLKADPPLIPPPALPGPFTALPGGDGGTAVVPKLEPVAPSQAAGAIPDKNWRKWITADDYPTAALRQDIQGTVVISVMIGADGRVRSCLVTQSSGSKLLDDATCRLYAARARFTPARDADGNPTTAQRTDRYRWQIPNE